MDKNITISFKDQGMKNGITNLVMSDIFKKMEKQLAQLEANMEDATNRITKIETYLKIRVAQVKELMVDMAKSGNPMMITTIVDILGDVDRISERLAHVDITPSGYKEISLESIMDKEHDEVEEYLI